MKKQLRDRLREAIERSGATQEQVAKACGVTGANVNQWLSGRIRHINPIYLPDLAQATNVNLVWLLTGKGPRGLNGKAMEGLTEIDLLKAYRKLTPALRERFTDLVIQISRAG